MISNPFNAARAAASQDDTATRRSDFIDPIVLAKASAPGETPSEVSEAPAPAQIDASNRRIAPRIGIAVEVTLKSEHNFYAGFSENISEGGLFVATDKLQPVGSMLKIALSLPKVKGSIEALAEVRWVRPASAVDPEIPAGMGLQFASLDWEAEDVITDFVRGRQPIFYVD